jgi:hypothetical protein
MHGDRIRNFSDGQPETTHHVTQLVSCFWCERIHVGKHPLSVCPACVASRPTQDGSARAANGAQRAPSASYSTLRLLKMAGSHPLNGRAIDEALTRTSPGNYALGYMDDDSFSVFYVGRSDSDVRGRLHEWVGMPSQHERYASCAKAPWAVHRRGGFPVDVPMSGRVGNADTRYTHFAYSYSHSAAEAFGKERRNFEDFGGRGVLDNRAEPVSMAG